MERRVDYLVKDLRRPHAVVWIPVQMSNAFIGGDQNLHDIHMVRQRLELNLIGKRVMVTPLGALILPWPKRTFVPGPGLCGVVSLSLKVRTPMTSHSTRQVTMAPSFIAR